AQLGSTVCGVGLFVGVQSVHGRVLAGVLAGLVAEIQDRASVVARLVAEIGDHAAVVAGLIAEIQGCETVAVVVATVCGVHYGAVPSGLLAVLMNGRDMISRKAFVGR